MTKEISDEPFVSVVIPHKGDDASLGQCLSSLREQDCPQQLYEILIVLNEPEPRLLECEIKEREFVLWEPRYFSYCARNHGIENSRGDVIAFTDSDTIPSQSWITEGVNALTLSRADLVAGHIEVTTSRNTHVTAVALYEQLFAFDQEKNVRGGFSATANLFARRATFTRYGLFEDTAISGEDFEWTKTAVEQGATLSYAPLASVEHPARESWGDLLGKARRTTLPYVDIADASEARAERLRSRVQFHRASTPSASRLRTLSLPQRMIAYLVRLILLSYKALCILRIPPAFQRDLDVVRTKRATQVRATQGASV